MAIGAGVERLRRLAYFHTNPSTQLPKYNQQRLNEAVAHVLKGGRMETYSRECAQIMATTLERWSAEQERTGSIDIVMKIRALIMEINTRLLLGDSFSATCGHEFAEHFLALEHYSGHLVARILPELVFLPPVKRALEARLSIAKLLEKEVAKLRQSGEIDDESEFLLCLPLVVTGVL